MPSPIIDGLIAAWKKNQDYAVRLVADLSEKQMIAQPASDPAAPANHPAWVLSHLNAYLPIIAAIIQGNEFEDPKEHRFGMLSKPESSPGVYQAKQALVDEFVSGHETVSALLEACDDGMFSNPISLPRWAEVLPNAGIALPYLMLNHENGHLGQVSTWRRVQGLPSV